MEATASNSSSSIESFNVVDIQSSSNRITNGNNNTNGSSSSSSSSSSGGDHPNHHHHNNHISVSVGSGGHDNSVASTTSSTPSQVIRVVVENMLYPITLDALYTIFSRVGKVQKIVTFTKNNVFQTLVQFADIASSIQAKLSLEGQNMFAGGANTLRIEYSKLQTLAVKYNNDKSRDYTQPGLGAGNYHHHQSIVKSSGGASSAIQLTSSLNGADGSGVTSSDTTNTFNTLLGGGGANHSHSHHQQLAASQAQFAFHVHPHGTSASPSSPYSAVGSGLQAAIAAVQQQRYAAAVAAATAGAGGIHHHLHGNGGGPNGTHAHGHSSATVTNNSSMVHQALMTNAAALSGLVSPSNAAAAAAAAASAAMFAGAGLTGLIISPVIHVSGLSTEVSICLSILRHTFRLSFALLLFFIIIDSTKREKIHFPFLLILSLSMFDHKFSLFTLIFFII